MLLLRFDQLLVCPRSSFVGVAYFLSPKAIPRFRPFSVVRQTQVFAFSKKKVMKKVIIHNFNTVNVLSSFFRCSRLS